MLKREIDLLTQERLKHVQESTDSPPTITFGLALQALLGKDCSCQDAQQFVEDDNDSDPDKFFDFQMDVLWRIGPERHSGMLPSR